ncbi:hypothetical protein DEU56DRAFT_783985 [Suillus clintonianus]|uniref:uncharacterized protein n=1 Tax=Suillus clintonianus TaxID=1904413 RepID=UPI001B880E8B|nr:uncharacterized protein DEU56DRAFT_783985 [Suillus clintonianus]KAG2148067.1 hypothetical protein DEU56DRAFT_783985 [Suillus clintonianus]
MNPFRRNVHHDERERTSSGRRFRFFSRDKNRVAGGYKAALSNPRTSRQGRKHAKQELRAMGRERETHLPFMTKVKRALGIRSTPRNKRESNKRQKRRAALP